MTFYHYSKAAGAACCPVASRLNGSYFLTKADSHIAALII
jgi:hypothetical protein